MLSLLFILYSSYINIRLLACFSSFLPYCNTFFQSLPCSHPLFSPSPNLSSNMLLHSHPLPHPLQLLLGQKCRKSHCKRKLDYSHAVWVKIALVQNAKTKILDAMVSASRKKLVWQTVGGETTLRLGSANYRRSTL